MSKGSGSRLSGVRRDRIQDHPGPVHPGPQGPRAPGSIQHLPRITLEGPWLPGQKDRRYSNREAASLPRPYPTRRETGPLSPEARSRTRGTREACTGWYPVLGVVYPGSNGMALAGHLGHYYRGTHPPTLPSSIIFFRGAGLAWLPVVVMTRLLQRRPSQLLLCQLRPP